MIEFPVPTRAEVTDVANAVYEQADAVMLSGETASGKYPVEAVETLDRIVRRTERYPGVDYASKMNLSSARMHLAAAAAQMASELQFKGFVAITQFGRGAEYISNMRPRGLPIYAFINSERTCKYATLLPFGLSVPCGRLFDQSGVHTGASTADVAGSRRLPAWRPVHGVGEHPDCGRLCQFIAGAEDSLSYRGVATLWGEQSRRRSDGRGARIGPWGGI